MIRVLLCIATVAVAGCWTTAPSEQERLALLTAHDLEAHGLSVPGPLTESFKRVTVMGDHYSIQYECTGPHPRRVYLAVHITVARNAASAKLTMMTKLAAMAATFRALDMTLRPDSTEPYRDESYFGSLMKDSAQVGHVVMVRHDVSVYMVVVAGLRVGSPSEWRALLDSKLARLDSITASSR